MKTISRYFTLAAGALMLMGAASSCIDETFPTDVATNEQLGSSSKATEALLWAMPAHLNKFNSMERASGDERHYDWGYGSMMHIRDVMGQDMPIMESNYDQYYYWEVDKYQGEDYVFAGLIWKYYYKQIQTANNLIAAINEESANDTQLGYLAMGCTFRALCYLDAAQMYEFKSNDKVSSNNGTNDVAGLTIPIVTEKTTEQEARNNPRVSHKEMSEFILSDLDKAEQYIGNIKRSSKTLPDLAAVYGLKARLYLWNEDYANAEQYARKAIDLGSNKPMSQAEWLDPITGFNTLSVSSWIWGAQATKEDEVVQTGIVNWTSWMCPEASYGYSGAGVYPLIDAKLYSEIDDADWRKLAFLAPAGSPLVDQIQLTSGEANTFIGYYDDPDALAYAGIKFRANSGNLSDYAIGSASAYPIMRIEEMYFIEAEAAAQQDGATRGAQLIEQFMQTYRYASYVCKATSKEGVIDEIIRQKRVEFWGEGLSFFDIKRRNTSVIRNYEGSNWYPEAAINTEGRPAWMNICISRAEKNNNTALPGFENPDPSAVYGN